MVFLDTHWKSPISQHQGQLGTRVAASETYCVFSGAVCWTDATFGK